MSYLSNVSFDRALRVKEGVFVHNYAELLTELRLLSDEEFKESFDKGLKIINWIKENQRDERLLLKLEIASTRREFARLIEKRIRQLEWERREERLKEERIPEKRKLPLYVNVLFFIAFAVVIFAFMHYIFENDKDSWKNYFEQNSEMKRQLEHYSERIEYLEKQNLELKNNLSLRDEQILPIEVAMPTPRDRISSEDIKVDSSKVIILVADAYLAEFADTGSMLPALGSDSTGIQIKPVKETDIYPGDVISYRLESGIVIIHRVLEVGYDSEGWYAITKGDNNYFADRTKVRFYQIEKVLVGIIY
ncbi:MAG: hypothetical protein ACP5N2_02890 [Candidatus Nanoarchaeia archaeon]